MESELRPTFGSTRALVALLAFVLGVATVPHRVCERDAARWFDGDPHRTDALANGVARWTAQEIEPSGFHIGEARFDGEWLFVTYAMAALGFGQLALDREDIKPPSLARMEHCLDVLLDPRLRIFDRAAWGEDALDDAALAGNKGHIGVLGYVGLALALHRQLRPESRFVARETAVIAAIERRFSAGEPALVPTFPDQVYPADNAAALAALAVHGRSAHLPAGLAALRRAIDPQTALLGQTLSGRARASGTALAAYFLAFADPALSLTLFRALEARQFRTVLGFGGMLEVPTGTRPAALSDDTGPVILGFGVAATGFAIGAARALRDRERFTALCATAHLFGGPLDEDGTRTYALGGPLGDAVLFAMLTAPRAGRFVS